MRLLPGQPQDVIGESITSYSLMRAAVNNPDILPRVWQVYNDEDTSPLSAILAEKGYTTKGLREGTWNDRFRTVGSNHVMYPIASSDKRKFRVASNASGLTFYSAAYPTKPGYRGTPFYVYFDSNLARPKEVVELDDNRTKLYCYDPQEPIEIDGVWRYEVKLVTNSEDAYVNTELLREGAEAAAVMTIYEQDFSETGSESYTFDGWGHAYMTLQRVKMSFSGTAEAMKTSKEWYQYQSAKGSVSKTYIEHAEKKMYKKAAKYHEYQLINGESTVNPVDGSVFLKDKNGREQMAGSGILYGGDGAIERPMTSQGWTKKFLESMIRDADVRIGKDGMKELVMLAGIDSLMDFSSKMAEWGFKTQNNNVVGDGASKGVNMTYSYYEMADVRIIPKRYRDLDSPHRPTRYTASGHPRGGWDAIIVPIGFTENGDHTCELVQLRPPVSGTLSGMNRGGQMASSVDGESRHFLWQTGVIARVPIFRAFMPYAA
jgi:hypothetical protein